MYVAKKEKRHVRERGNPVRAHVTKAWTLLRAWEDALGPEWHTQWSPSSVLHMFTSQQAANAWPPKKGFRGQWQYWGPQSLWNGVYGCTVMERVLESPAQELCAPGHSQ